MLLDQIFDYLNAQLRKSIFLRNFNVFVGCGLLFYFIILVVKILRPIFSKIPRSFDSNNTNSEELNEYFENNDLKPFLPKNDHVPFSGTKVTLSRGADEFFEVLNDRRSIRTFSRKKVDFNVIRKCIEAAGTSPSGAHTEPWTFCVVEDQEMKVQIREVIEREEFENYARRMSRQWTVDLIPLKTNHQKEYLTDAPYLILVFKQIYGYRDDGSKKQHYYNEISVSIATGILLCALQSAGLNSLVTTPLNCGPSLKNLLCRPKNEKLLILIPVGYASDDCKVPNLHRKHVDEIIVKY